MADPNSNGEIRNQPKDWEGAWTEQGREELANPDSSLRLNVRQQISEQGKRHSNGLATQVDQIQKNWPTPSTRDHKGVTREAGFAMER